MLEVCALQIFHYNCYQNIQECVLGIKGFKIGVVLGHGNYSHEHESGKGYEKRP